jgi:very-short-patch-repair endonuclease
VRESARELKPAHIVRQTCHPSDSLDAPATPMSTSPASDDQLRHVHPAILARARELRHPLTPAEKKLWTRVRNNQLGPHIRRQHPIWRFIADFYCAQARLVIEIDGDSHAESDQAEYDAARTDWLEWRGYRVIRFDNVDVHRNLDNVLEAIRAACLTARSPSPRPSPAGRGRNAG